MDVEFGIPIKLSTSFHSKFSFSQHLRIILFAFSIHWTSLRRDVGWCNKENFSSSSSALCCLKNVLNPVYLMQDFLVSSSKKNQPKNASKHRSAGDFWLSVYTIPYTCFFGVYFPRERNFRKKFFHHRCRVNKDETIFRGGMFKKEFKTVFSRRRKTNIGQWQAAFKRRHVDGDWTWKLLKTEVSLAHHAWRKED